MVLFDSLLCDVFAAIVVLLCLFCWYMTSEFDYFKKLGVAYVRPYPILGNFGDVVVGRTNMNEAAVPLYEELKTHRYGGVFMARAPTLVVCDPELIKVMLTKEFSSFHDRAPSVNEESDPMAANLFSMTGTRWKSLRSKLTPTFTSGRLKEMLPLIKDCSKELAEFLRKSSGEDVDMHDTLVRYATDVIGSCAFGISCHSFAEGGSEFYTMSRKIFKPSILSVLAFVLSNSSKIFAKVFSFKRLFPGVHEFFINLMKSTIDHRKSNNVERNDFVQRMMELQKGDEGKSKESPEEVIFTSDLVAAQAFLFFIAGLDTVAFTIGYALYQISIEPRYQAELADEVLSVISRHNGELTYEGLKEMKLLDRIISETLRMKPPAGILMRMITNPNFTFPGSDVRFRKELQVMVPISGLHLDPDIYPDPYKFDPDRFTEEACSKRHPYAFLPFGEGPRVCIASRFALLECKLCLASLIKDFKFSVCSKTQIPLEMQARQFAPKKGIYLKVEQR